jgi:hypothetical protein
MIKKLVVITLLIAVLLPIAPGASLAQDENWTCDEGPNDILVAAQAALNNDDLARAWWLAARAEALCANDRVRLFKASSLRRRAEARQGLDVSLEPGFVDLGDYKLFMKCVGEGNPTIIFENAFGTGSTEWKDVQPAVSTYTRACIYDRLGIGISNRVPPDTVRTTQDQVDDLMTLLDIANIEPPYILVGHSIAGFNILLFVDQYPDLVQGIVLVDASHPDQLWRFAEVDPEFAMPSPDDRDNVERMDFEASAAQAVQAGDFGDMPLFVLTAGLSSDPEEIDQIWFELQDDHASRSTNSRHVIAERSSHYIMNTQPDLIIDAVLWVLDEVRAAEE